MVINEQGLLRAMKEAYKADGYEIVPISELILKENYTIDGTGKQCQVKE